MSDVLSAILDNPTSLDHVRLPVADDVTYVSLNCDNPDLHGMMPWYDSHKHAAMFGRFTYRFAGMSRPIVAKAKDGRRH